MIAMLADWHQPKQAEETAIYISTPVTGHVRDPLRCKGSKCAKGKRQ